MTKCPVCLVEFDRGAFRALSDHLVEKASASDPQHVRWLNQNISRQKVAPEELERRLRVFFDLDSDSLKSWIKKRFIAKFFGPRPHPFVVALQHPTRAVLLGYVVEHQHFLRQWVRSCAYIMARTDERDVVLYELDNLNTEFGGLEPGRVAHYELLLRMGESLGLPRAETLRTPPLSATRAGIEEWNRMATQEPWVAAMAAMHSLELIAHRDLVKEGATVHYFDPAILEGDAIPRSAQEFLREGYDADVGHSDQALDLVTKYGGELGLVETIQSTFLRSADLFDDYLTARLERAELLEAG